MSKPPICPLLKKPCIEGKCAWYTQIRGSNPNTGQPVDEHQCVINFLPFLLIENSQQQRGTAAAVESFRNDSVSQTNTLTQVLIQTANLPGFPQLIEEANVKILSSEDL